MKIVSAVVALAMLSSVGNVHSKDYIQEALEAPYRLERDLKADKGRQPDKVLKFFGIKPGMQVFDLFAGGEYYSTILNGVVGENGGVTAHNNESYLNYASKTLAERAEQEELANVSRLTSEANALELPEGKYDAALAILAWHDFYYREAQYGWYDIDTQAVVKALCHGLKSGAVLGIVDHVAAPGGDVWDVAQNLHRIDPERIKSDLEGSCFEFEAEADFLRNPADDLSISMSDEKVRGKTDRVVYRYRRK